MTLRSEFTTSTVPRGFPVAQCKESACQCRTPGFDPGGEDPLEKEMASHSSVPAWETPWTGEPGELWSTGSERVGHD